MEKEVRIALLEIMELDTRIDVEKEAVKGLKARRDGLFSSLAKQALEEKQGQGKLALEGKKK